MFDYKLCFIQLDTLMMEVLQSPTEMTAMDLFQVNLTLFPTVSLSFSFHFLQFLIGNSIGTSWWGQR